MLIRKLFDLYLNSSLHAALAVIAFAGVAMLNFEIPQDPDLLFFS